MDLNPITINGVVQSGAVVEFNTYDDQEFTNGAFLERVTTDANGVATLTETVPSGKLLYASVEVTDGGTTYSIGRFFTDSF